MKAIDRKLWRDLWGMRGQALAIALVIVSGVAVFVMSLSTLDSLLVTRDTYYQNNRFAEVFVSLKRAPESLAPRIRDIPGVQQVETRVLALAKMEVEGFDDPVTGRLVSIPDHGPSLLNQIYLRKGRLITPGRDDEAVVSEAFANAHGLEPGDKLEAIINGRRKTLTLVGMAESPEYIYQIAPGAMFPDFKRFGVLWMGRSPLASANDMDGAFNSLSLTLASGAQLEDVIERLDNLLEPYGGRGAYGRQDQFSNQFLTEELKQLQTLATVFPVIFLGVAAFLLNVVISRLVSTQREQIAGLKAFGYSNLAVGVHYTKLVLLIVSFGILGGLALGVWLGRGLSEIYTEFYRFPFLLYTLQPGVVVFAALISATTSIAGTLFSVRRAALLPPAQAMRPQPPASYRVAFIERIGLQRWLSQPTRMIGRHIERKPVKSLLSIIGLAFACAIMMVGRFQEDAIDYMVGVQFGISQREDLSVTFVEPASQRALYSLQSLEGVEHVEGFRAMPVRLRFEHRNYRTLVEGVEPAGQLFRVLDTRLQSVDLPAEGVVLTDHLGKILGVGVGDLLTIEMLEGSRSVVQVPVVGLTKQFLGVRAYMQREVLNRLLGEGLAISGVYLTVDPLHQSEVYAALNNMPRVAGVVIREASIRSFYDTLAQTILFFTSVATLLGSIIAFGVVYNSARIALSERARELASLRVLGFTRGEIAYILLGELAVFTLISIPLGFLIGWGLCGYLAANLQSDLYRVPLILELDTYAFAAAVVLVSAGISAYLIWRQLAKLDLVAVLKTKE